MEHMWQKSQVTGIFFHSSACNLFRMWWGFGKNFISKLTTVDVVTMLHEILHCTQIHIIFMLKTLYVFLKNSEEWGLDFCHPRQKFYLFLKTWNFSSTSTKAQLFSTSWFIETNSIFHDLFPLQSLLVSRFHLGLGSRACLFFWVFQSTILYTFLFTFILSNGFPWSN